MGGKWACLFEATFSKPVNTTTQVEIFLWLSELTPCSHCKTIKCWQMGLYRFFGCPKWSVSGFVLKKPRTPRTAPILECFTFASSLWHPCLVFFKIFIGVIVITFPGLLITIVLQDICLIIHMLVGGLSFMVFQYFALCSVRWASVTLFLGV